MKTLKRIKHPTIPGSLLAGAAIFGTSVAIAVLVMLYDGLVADIVRLIIK